MRSQKFVIIDDFYADPARVRALALRDEFKQKPGATYPGREAVICDGEWTSVRARLAATITEDVSGPCPKKEPFSQGKFRMAVAEDQFARRDGVHEDVQPWSGIIYLSLPEHCNGQGAIALYRHRETGALSGTLEWWLHVALTLNFDEATGQVEREEKYWAYMRDESHWEEIERIENVYNRAVLLRSQCFHASVGLFGTNKYDGRLTQHFEFYYPPKSRPAKDEAI